MKYLLDIDLTDSYKSGLLWLRNKVVKGNGMKPLIKYMLVLLIAMQSSFAISADIDNDKKAIAERAKAFSQAFVAGDIETIMEIYSPNARIVDVNSKIDSDILSIRKFWTPNKSSKWQLISHNTHSEELLVEGNMASDIGYYVGVSQHVDGRKVKFGGAYVIVWIKIEGIWRMHLDMWNDIKQ